MKRKKRKHSLVSCLSGFCFVSVVSAVLRMQDDYKRRILLFSSVLLFNSHTYYRIQHSYTHFASISLIHQVSTHTHKICKQRSLTQRPRTVSPYRSIYRQHSRHKASIHKSFASSASSTHLSISKTRFSTINCHPSCLQSLSVLPCVRM